MYVLPLKELNAETLTTKYSEKRLQNAIKKSFAESKM